MKFGELRRLFLNSSGDTADATRDFLLHLNKGYARVVSELSIPELYVPNASVTTTAQQDYVDVDCDAYSVETVNDQTTATPLRNEPDGWRGRARFFEAGEARPPLGVPSFWVRRGNRLYLRPTPSDARPLLVTFKMQAPTIGDDGMALHAITPPQYDMAIVYFALANYFTLHPPELPGGGADYQRASSFESAALKELHGVDDPVGNEEMDRSYSVRQRGYRMGVRR